MCIEEHFNVRTENRFVKLLETGYPSGLNGCFRFIFNHFFSRLFTIIVLLLGAFFVLSNDLTPGELMSFYAILGYFTGPLNSLINVNKTIQNAFIASDRLFEIMDVIKGLKEENKTVIMIAHRLSTVLNADKIVVMEKGKVLESGSHKVLFEMKGKYYNLWQKKCLS